ncbi:MAG: TonB-dependent receptor [Sphingobacteriales bacterium]|nr:TonB-dependent receptor [Sphingobacteriales bacterium]
MGIKIKKWDVFASVNHDQTDGIRDSTDFNITNGYAKIGYTINEHFSAMADFSIAKFDAIDNGPVFKPAFFNVDILRGKTSFALMNKFAKSEGALKVYHNFGDHDLSDGFISSDRNSGIMLYQTFRLFQGNIFTVGTDIIQYGGKANGGVAKDKLKTVNDVAGYVYTQQAIGTQLTASAGLRLENHSLFGTEWVPTGGVAFNPTNATTFKATVSKGFRSPSIMELYLYAPNPDLKPERMINYEISFLQSLLNNKLKFELTGYVADGSNMIQVVGVPPNAKRQNVGKFNNNGLEVSVNYMPLQILHLHSNYSYLHQETITLAAPKQQFNINANYSYKIWSLFAGLQYIDKLTNSLKPVKTQSYALVNARLSVMPFKNLSIFVTGNNLLNQNYEINYGYPMPKTNFSAGINLKF